MAYSETLDIVVLGASFAGPSVAHNLFKNVFPYLRMFDGAPTYRVVLVAPSSYLYWNIAAPRALVSAELVPFDKTFSPVMKGFENYSPEEFVFIQGAAGLIDTAQRQVSITLTSRPNVVDSGNHRQSIISTTTERTATTSRGSAVKTLNYHALILATGSSADSPLLSLHGPHEKMLAALDDFHKRLRTANSIVVVGGGASGVETAGQLAVCFNSTPSSLSSNHWKKPTAILTQLLGLLKRDGSKAASKEDSVLASLSAGNDPPRTPKTITLISGHERLLSNLGPQFGRKAEQKLRRNHVHILHNIRLVATTEAQPLGAGAQQQQQQQQQTACYLDDTTITSDLLVACTGVRPNTAFLPSALVNAAGYVETHPTTLRCAVEAAGPRVYAIGDCAAYSKNYTIDVYDTMPVLLHNLRNDLLAHELRLQYPPAGEGSGLQDSLDELVDKHFSPNPTDTLLMPCTKRGGVGILFNLRAPSAFVHLMKGRLQGGQGEGRRGARDQSVRYRRVGKLAVSPESG